MELLNQEKMGMPLDIKIKFNCFKKVFCTALIFHFLSVHSQSIKVKVIDSQTFDSIPFSTIYFSSSKGIISDKSGVFELVLNKIPILRTIYSAVGQLTETFAKSKGDKKSVVLVEYPRKGTWAVGFATKENKGEMAEKTNKKLINVFVPTTPNPTSGFLLMFPIDEVIYLNMTFEEASKFIVSAGTSAGKN